MNPELESSEAVRTDQDSVDVSFMAGGGETGALIRSIDWEQSPLGPVSGWPQSLRTTVSICLNSRFPIVIFWGDELVMLYNDAYRTIPGGKHPRSMGQPGLEVWAEIRDVIEPMLRRVMSTGEATWSEDLMLPIVRLDRPEESYFTFTYSPIRDESGGVGGVFCAVVETTEKVIEERRLRLLNALAEATQAKTPAEACAHASEQIARSPHDVPFALIYLLGTNGFQLAGVANIEAGTARSPASIALGDHATWPFEENGAQESGQVVELGGVECGAREAVVLPIARSGGGRPLGFIVAGVSPMLRRAASYDRFHNLLSASISQSVSSAAAYAEESRRAESLAELDRAKTTFFSNVSHEFRTPLTLMLAPIQDLLGMPDGAAIDRPTVNLLHRNAVRLLKLVNTLLEFSRIEAGRVEAVYEPVDLAALTMDLASTFRAAIERAGLEFVVDCPALAEPIYVDRDMWEKIVLNLLSNALKFTFEGSITVRLRMVDDGACLEVADTGIGIAKNDLLRVFERFHRIEGARSRSHEGSGIGLALIQELVRLHGGGDIEVTSRPGTGTTFRLRIPRGAEHLPPARIRAKRQLMPTTLGAQGFIEEAARWDVPPRSDSPLPPSTASDKDRIVFADDNADMRDYVTRLLSDRWTVETFSDGRAALESIRRLPPALVLSDVMMPSLDGFSLVRAMRAEAGLRGVPVILLSARAGQEEASIGLSAGANDYIAKPFSARELLVRVATNLASARAAREMAIREETQRANFYRHFMQAPFPVAVFRGPRHIVELANPQILKAWRKGPEIVGSPLAEGIPALRGQPLLDYLDEVFRTGIAYEGREEVTRLPVGPNGELEDLYFNFVYAPLRDTKGTVEGILVSAFDVSAQVRARREAERALARAQLSAAERAHALDEADRASRAKDEFLATMSHELRTPLTAMLGWTTILQETHADRTKLMRGLASIERNARMQERLVNDLLDVSRIISGKLRLSIKRTQVSAVIYAALEVVRQSADAKGVRLIVNLDPDTGALMADTDRLQQIVWNLLSNAVRFTPSRGSLTVTSARVSSSIELSVQDTGLGIAPEQLPFIFDRFKQIDGSTTRAHGGLGLGLAIVRHLVEAHGGTVSARSAGLGTGTTFTVSLPIHAVDDAEGAAQAVNAREAETEADSAVNVASRDGLVGGRVLVVDDQEDSLEILRIVLERAGAMVATERSARQALARAQSTSFDVIVSDIGMPEMDGYEFMHRLRSHGDGVAIPAIALTAFAREEDGERARRAGYQLHLSKPVNMNVLLASIRDLIRPPVFPEDERNEVT